MLHNILAFNFVSDGQLVIPWDNDHTDKIDNKEALIYSINCAEKVGAEKLQLESIHAPIKHKPNLRDVEQ